MTNRIFITGDTHNNLEINRLSRKRFPLGRELSKQDIVLVAGDFGFPWDGLKSDEYWLNWIEDLPFSVAFCDGNHINFSLLYQYPTELWNGGQTHILRPHIHHLMRGEIFNFKDKKMFVFGGARSTDQYRRKEGISWWPQEQASYQECDYAAENLRKHNFQIDYILTHCAPNYIVDKLYPYENQYDSTTNFLEKFVRMSCKFNMWVMGHYHLDRNYDNNKYNILYQDIMELTLDGQLIKVN